MIEPGLTEGVVEEYAGVGDVLPLDHEPDDVWQQVAGWSHL